MFMVMSPLKTISFNHSNDDGDAEQQCFVLVAAGVSARSWSLLLLEWFPLVCSTYKPYRPSGDTLADHYLQVADQPL